MIKLISSLNHRCQKNNYLFRLTLILLIITKTTLEFHKKIFIAPNLLGVFTGHFHQSSIEMIKGKPQIVADDNASGEYLDINFLPMDEKDEKLIFRN